MYGELCHLRLGIIKSLYYYELSIYKYVLAIVGLLYLTQTIFRFLNQAHAWFLKINSVQMYVCVYVCVCVCVCVSALEAMSGVIWTLCDWLTSSAIMGR